MSISTLATTEARRVRRSRAFAVLVAALVVAPLVIVAMASPEAFSGAYFHRSRTVPEESIVVLHLASPTWLVFSVSLVVPLLGLLLGSSAIVDERLTGRVRTTLTTPCSRRALVAGTLLGRALALAAAIGVGLSVAAIAAYARFGVVPATTYWRFVLVTILYGWLFIAIGTALSALFATKRRTVVGAVATYVLLSPIGWNALVAGVPALDAPRMRALEPTTGYAILVTGGDPALEATARVDAALGPGQTTPFEAWASIPDQVPVVLTTWGATSLLIGWFLAAVLVATVAFERTDLHR
ncbi:ABC transporter permease [Halopiger goleimassiliensis]|uniref:ABC transporter permease n=1 Tax=Halopiger goleimassiliensis TaxID=1293048 RepID=UPI000677F08F|nr:ABC transporter permease subunit [Halopiger goleimassiliensis]